MLRRLFADVTRALVNRTPVPATAPESDSAPNPLELYFLNNPDRRMKKWFHYLGIYHRHFARFRGRSPVVIEIGVWQGGSLQMWHHYFGPGTRVVGVDSDPKCSRFEDETTTILIGDQADRAFLSTVRERFPHVDILIDDGGHLMRQQITTFEELYPHVQPNGVYLCEDVHTSYWPSWGGGFRKPGTFVEYTKSLIDQLHAWYTDEAKLNTAEAELKIDGFTRSTYALHFYDSIVVFEKRAISPPKQYESNPGRVE
jgi:hypothetical protein